MRFVQREQRRGRRYHGIILDPPSFGRGPQGHRWKFTSDMPKLLEACRQLLSHDARFLLVTCHTTGVSAGELGELVDRHCRPGRTRPGEAVQLSLHTSDGRRLESGVGYRWRA